MTGRNESLITHFIVTNLCQTIGTTPHEEYSVGNKAKEGERIILPCGYIQGKVFRTNVHVPISQDPHLIHVIH